MPVPLELLIERWFAIGWLVFGLSHLLYPGKWAALVQPLRERATGGLLLAVFNLPLGLIVVLGHNVWVWGIPVVVTLAGWAMTLKSVVYLLFPRALLAVMPSGERMERGFRIAGAVAVLLGALLAYDSFCQGGGRTKRPNERPALETGQRGAVPDRRFRQRLSASGFPGGRVFGGFWGV